MKNIEYKYINICNEMLLEYVHFFNGSKDLDKSLIKKLRNSLYKLHNNFDSDVKSQLIKYSNNDLQLKIYLMDVYVEGFMRMKFICDRYNEDLKDKYIESTRINRPGKCNHPDCEIKEEFFNFGFSIDLLCRNIRVFVINNLGKTFSRIDPKGYNISRQYFKEFNVSDIRLREKNG